jgi:ferrous iron transport protein A
VTEKRETVLLTSLTPGDAARVVDVTGEGAFRGRLLDMGFVKGAFVRVIKHAPLMNPIEYCIGGTHVTLRQAEAARIRVEQVTFPPGCHRPGKGHRQRRFRWGWGHRRGPGCAKPGS